MVVGDGLLPRGISTGDQGPTAMLEASGRDVISSSSARMCTTGISDAVSMARKHGNDGSCRTCSGASDVDRCCR